MHLSWIKTHTDITKWVRFYPVNFPAARLPVNNFGWNGFHDAAVFKPGSVRSTEICTGLIEFGLPSGGRSRGNISGHPSTGLDQSVSQCWFFHQNTLLIHHITTARINEIGTCSLE